MASGQSSIQNEKKLQAGKSYMAKPFEGKTEEELNKYIDDKWQRFVIQPSYDEKVNWDVYILCKSFFKHYSMLFLRPGCIEGFVIHLKVNEDKIEFHLEIKNLRFFSHEYPDLKALSLGTTNELTAKYIITTAHDTLVSLGYYHAVLNNCQDYCKEIATKIKVSDKFTNWRDALLAEVFGGSVTLRGASGISYARLQSASGLLISVKELYEKYNTTTRQL